MARAKSAHTETRALAEMRVRRGFQTKGPRIKPQQRTVTTADPSPVRGKRKRGPNTFPGRYPHISPASGYVFTQEARDRVKERKKNGGY